jgi:hypothetical protein
MKTVEEFLAKDTVLKSTELHEMVNEDEMGVGGVICESLFLFILISL